MGFHNSRQQDLDGGSDMKKHNELIPMRCRETDVRFRRELTRPTISLPRREPRSLLRPNP
jgi:hypothetical protein